MPLIGMAAASFVRSILLGSALALAACAEPEPEGASTAAAAAGNETPPPDTPVSHPDTTLPAGAADPDSATSGPPRPSDCNASQAERFIGREAGETIRSELAEAVAPISAIRWVGPGDATTEDYSPQRLNVMLDVGGVIRSVHCG